MFENLTEKLTSALQNLQGKKKISDVNIATTLKHIRRALLAADVNYDVVKKIISEVKMESIGQKVLNSLSPGQVFTKIVNDKLKVLMGSESTSIDISANPSLILIAGLQGSGKTTFSAKLALKLKREGKQVLLVACDVYRPAAIQQLKTLAETVGVDIYLDQGNKDPLAIAQEAVKFAKANHKKIIIVDTAGRLAIDQAMMTEIKMLKIKLKPQETLFVVDSMTGQDATNTAKAFNDKIDFDGIVLTKLDGDTRGGAAISIRAVAQKPIKFVSTGEKPEQLEIFYPDRMASRILGMGDVVTLVEQVEQEFSDKEADKLAKRLYNNKINFDDLLKQLKFIKKLGGAEKLVKMLPNSSQMLPNAKDEKRLIIFEAIILSMTPKERRNPNIINFSRKKRLAAGSGTTLQTVNLLIKHLEQTKKTVKKMSRMGNRKALESMFGDVDTK